MSRSRRTVLAIILLFSLAGITAFAIEPVPTIPTPEQLAVRESLKARADRQLATFLANHDQPLATTAAEVVAGHLEASGGAEAWAAVQTLEVYLRPMPIRGDEFILVRQYSRPLNFRQGMAGGHSATVTDGRVVWRVSGGQKVAADIPELTTMASIDNFFLDPAAAGVDMEFVGVEILNHEPVYHLRRAFPVGIVEELYFSVNSGLLVERFDEYRSGSSWFSFWEYREVEGLKFPHLMLRSVGENGPPHGVAITEIRINPELDEDLFLPITMEGGEP